jgi:enoyl-CoA hydratase/carnithine racemase
VTFALFEQRGAVALVTLNRPDRLNAISNALLADLQAAIDRAESAEDIRAVVLCGAGRAFCAGEDLKELDQVTASDTTIQAHVAAIQNITRTIRCSSKVYVTATHGYAVGGGFEWLINGDLVVAADDLIAFFPEMERALFPTGGVSWLLPLAVGYHRTMELVLLGERQSADQLQKLGLVNWVVPVGERIEKALEVARMVATRSPVSVARFKKLLNQDLAPLMRAIDLEQQYTIETFQQPAANQQAVGFAVRKTAAS